MLSYEESIKSSGSQEICIGDDIGDVGNVKDISFIFPVFSEALFMLIVFITMLGAVGRAFGLGNLSFALTDL